MQMMTCAQSGERKMISDTLFEAVARIEEYERSFGNYVGLRDEIGKVKGVMRALQAYLDAPPGGGRYPKYDAARTQLRAEIAALDVTGLASALDNLKSSWPTSEEV